MERAVRTRLTPLRIVVVYLVVGVAWILSSDRALEALVADPARRDELQTAKGGLFVVATGAMLFLLMRRQQAERRLRDDEVRAVIEGMADGVLVVDRAGQVVDVNAAAARLLGARRREDLLGPLAAFAERLHVRSADGHAVPPSELAAQRALRGETVTGVEVRLRALDAREVLASVTSAPVRLRADAAPRLAVTVLRDLGDVKGFEEAREEFLATAAHEFKTPLAVVKAYAQLLRKRGQGDASALDTMVRQIDRLTRMLQQILEVSRFRVAGAELHPERFDLAALLVEVAGAMGAGGGRRIVVEAPGPAPVLADRDRIGQVVSSLLENAVRFSPAGGDVEAALARAGPDAVVSVRDHGLGIPRERQARIFERYYRAHAGTAQDYGGLGVGLDVSREIVARHGGRIWFESEPGLGSTFSFSLPIAAEDGGEEPLPS